MAKLYVCRECSYVFPEELSHLIESNIQVFHGFIEGPNDPDILIGEYYDENEMIPHFKKMTKGIRFEDFS